jgi:hypothetical protein
MVRHVDVHMLFSEEVAAAILPVSCCFAAWRTLPEYSCNSEESLQDVHGDA